MWQSKLNIYWLTNKKRQFKKPEKRSCFSMVLKKSHKDYRAEETYMSINYHSWFDISVTNTIVLKDWDSLEQKHDRLIL